MNRIYYSTLEAAKTCGISVRQFRDDVKRLRLRPMVIGNYFYWVRSQIDGILVDRKGRSIRCRQGARLINNTRKRK